MNYLAHAYLSFGNADTLVGNLCGDHIKGLAPVRALSPAIGRGVMLHRKIDAYADLHPAARRACLVFKTDYGLYSGAIVDTINDHFLANDAGLFMDEHSLLAFTQQTYTLLDSRQDMLPSGFAAYYGRMKEQNWLYNYRTVRGIERSLTGLWRRATRMQPPEKAYEIFITNYYHLNQCYLDLIRDLIPYTKAELIRLEEQGQS